MQRREFMKQAAITAAVTSASNVRADGKTSSNPIAKRNLGKTGERLSIIGFGGIVVMDEQSAAAANIVAEAVDRGINYFDVAPSYGNAQERLGPALDHEDLQRVVPHCQHGEVDRDRGVGSPVGHSSPSMSLSY